MENNKDNLIDSDVTFCSAVEAEELVDIIESSQKPYFLRSRLSQERIVKYCPYPCKEAKKVNKKNPSSLEKQKYVRKSNGKVDKLSKRFQMNCSVRKSTQSKVVDSKPSEINDVIEDIEMIQKFKENEYRVTQIPSTSTTISTQSFPGSDLNLLTNTNFCSHSNEEPIDNSLTQMPENENSFVLLNEQNLLSPAMTSTPKSSLAIENASNTNCEDLSTMGGEDMKTRLQKVVNKVKLYQRGLSERIREKKAELALRSQKQQNSQEINTTSKFEMTKEERLVNLNLLEEISSSALANMQNNDNLFDVINFNELQLN